MKDQLRNVRTQVIIIGGGITGLAAALFLKQQDVDFILLEKHRGTSIYPRARTIDIRAMELFRSLGLNEELREGGKALAPAWGIIRGNNMVEALQHSSGNPPLTPKKLMEAQQEMRSMAEQSPETTCRCTQDISEAILCGAARKNGSDLRFYHQLLSFEQKQNEVEVLVKDRATGGQYIVTAEYLIAADGANSLIRTELKIPTSGNISGTDFLNIYFEADLEPWIKGQEFSQLLIDTPDITGFLLTINNKDKWAFHLRYYPEKGEAAADYTDEKLRAILSRVLGITEVNISILKVLPWKLNVGIAGRMRERRAFLAGDAAHTMTPYAGKGANTGIQDAQNLAWKLAAVLKHRAGEALLDTYNMERQPVGARYATVSGELASANGLINDTLMITKWKDLLGLPNFGYISQAVIRATGLPFNYFTAEPGTRLPHIWLDEAHSASSLDWVQGRFVLITSDRAGWQAECDQVKEQFHLAVRLVILHDEKISEKWKELTGITGNGALLVRPDDFVAAKLERGGLIGVLKGILSA